MLSLEIMIMAKKIKNKNGPGGLAISFQNTMACNILDGSASQFLLDPLEGLTSNEFEQLIECIDPPEYWEPQVIISTRVSPPPANPNFTNGKTVKTYSKSHRKKTKRKRKKAKKETEVKPEEPVVTTTQVEETPISTISQQVVCSVCKDTDTVSKAYKAFACFDCRKSYYEICWKKSEPPSVCSNKENNCEITIETRENCSYCRLQKLYSIGYPIIKQQEPKTPKKQLDTNNNDNHNDDNDNVTNQTPSEPETCDRSVDRGSSCENNKADCEITSSDISLVCMTGRGECLLDMTTRGKCEYCRLRKYMALGLIDTIDLNQQVGDGRVSTSSSGRKSYDELPKSMSIETSLLNEDTLIGHKYLLVPEHDPNKSNVSLQNMSIQSGMSTIGCTFSAVLRPVEISIKIAPPLSREVPMSRQTRHVSPTIVVDDVESDGSDETIIVD